MQKAIDPKMNDEKKKTKRKKSNRIQLENSRVNGSSKSDQCFWAQLKHFK